MNKNAATEDRHEFYRGQAKLLYDAIVDRLINKQAFIEFHIQPDTLQDSTHSDITSDITKTIHYCDVTPLLSDHKARLYDSETTITPILRIRIYIYSNI